MKKFLYLIMLLASPAFADGWLQGQIEMRGMVIMSTFTASAAGGCVSGTTLVGTDNIGAERGTLLDENTINHTAAFVASASGTPATMEVYGAHTAANNCQGVIYSADGSTKLCQTNTFSCGDSDAWQSGTLSGCPAITASTSYKLAFIFVGFFTPAFNDNGDFDLCREAATPGSAPASISSCAEGAGDVGGTGHPMSIRVKC